MSDVTKCHFCNNYLRDEEGDYCGFNRRNLPCYIMLEDENLCGRSYKRFEYRFPLPSDCTGCTYEHLKGNCENCYNCFFNPYLKNNHRYYLKYRDEIYLHEYKIEDEIIEYD